MKNSNSLYFQTLYRILLAAADLYRVRAFGKYADFVVSKIVEIDNERGLFIFTIKHVDQKDNAMDYKFQMSLSVLDMSNEELEKYIDNNIKATDELFNKSIMNTPLSVIKDERKPISHIFFWKYL